MRIAVIVATRNRPQRAGGVIECARNLLSRRHEVEFIVAIDADDMASVDYFSTFAGFSPYFTFAGVTPHIQPRPIGVGDCWNRAAKAHPADFYLALTDDFWMSTPGWDAMMAHALVEGIDGNKSSSNLGIVAFHDPAQPTIAALFGMTSKWVRQNGFIFDPRFPFWWGDSALVETALFATGEGMPGTSSLRFASMPGNVNPRLRDMELWWALFAATRHERVETGRKIAREAGLPEIDDYAMGALIAQCEERDAAGRRNIPAVLASIERPAPPDAEYLAAKGAAEEYVRNSDEFPGYSGMLAAIPVAGATHGIPPK